MMKIKAVIFVLLIILAGCKNIEISDLPNYSKIISADEKTEFHDLMKSCKEEFNLEAGKYKIINDSGINFKIRLIEFKANDSKYSQTITNKYHSKSWEIHDWATINLNDDKVLTIPVREAVQVKFSDNQEIYVAVESIKDDSASVCVFDYILDKEFCDMKTGSDRFACFDDIGYVKGLEYCKEIISPDDRMTCENSALGMNG